MSDMANINLKLKLYFLENPEKDDIFQTISFKEDDMNTEEKPELNLNSLNF